jgi:hypothetical protein
MAQIGQFFPLRHFRDAMVTAFTPGPAGGVISPDNLAVMALWGVVAAVVAVRGLRWSAAAAGG